MIMAWWRSRKMRLAAEGVASLQKVPGGNPTVAPHEGKVASAARCDCTRDHESIG